MNQLPIWVALVSSGVSLLSAFVSGAVALRVFRLSQKSQSDREELLRRRDNLERVFLTLRKVLLIWADMAASARADSKNTVLGTSIKDLERSLIDARHETTALEMVILFYEPDLLSLHEDFRAQSRKFGEGVDDLVRLSKVDSQGKENAFAFAAEERALEVVYKLYAIESQLVRKVRMLNLT